MVYVYLSLSGVCVAYGASLVPCNSRIHSKNSPVVDSLIGGAREEDLEFPLSSRLFGPCVCGHEGPLVKPIDRVGVERSFAQQKRSSTERTRQEDDRVAATRCLQRDECLHVLQIVDLVRLAQARICINC